MIVESAFLPSRAHLIMAPVLLPLVTAAVMLLLGERRRRISSLVNIGSTLAGLVIAVVLMQWVHRGSAPGGLDMVGAIGIYLPANWQAPFGIVLAIDRLSAVMLLLTSILALGALIFAIARWDRAGVHFHPLFQIQVMGLNGAFLTADLFNLFVFFEVLLSASYGLLLHASGSARVKSGLHYIAINLMASFLFLVGATLIYGVTGTLNMADVALKVAELPEADRGLLQAGAAILGVAFLTKAGLWPLNFWLVPAYSAAGAPVAAMFAIMTKVGVYAVLRIGTLLFFSRSGSGATFGLDWLVLGGFATLAFGTIGLMASRQLGRLASYSLIVSAGTLLAAIGFGQASLTGAALYYLVGSTLGVSAMFLLVELIDRTRMDAFSVPVDEGDYVPFVTEDMQPVAESNLDEDQMVLIGRAIPAAMAFLGLAFIVSALVVTGMPPLSGFVAKVLMLDTLLGDREGMPGQGIAIWTMLALLIGSGLFAMIGLSRTGVRYFWAYPEGRPAPTLRLAECVPIALLLSACIALTIQAEPVMRYMNAAAAALHAPSEYITSVLATRPVPSAHPAAGAAR
ncbi:MAG: monovalent cation/H+ antiporter subunit D [Burkholderiaceae bacterium]|nr:monovalent cation/H+ antiporter subunit D [Burkholderiaceae bacterium]